MNILKSGNMKKKVSRLHFVFVGFLIMMFISCKQEKETEVLQDAVVIAGKISNPIDSVRQVILFPNQQKGRYVFDIDEQGNFRDTLKVEDPNFFRMIYGYGNAVANLYLKEGMNLTVKFDGENPRQSIVVDGDNNLPNEFITKKNELAQKIKGNEGEETFEMSKEEFDQYVDRHINAYVKELDERANDLDSIFVASIKGELKSMKNGFDYQYERYQKLKKLSAGSPSPNFKEYINYKGGTNSLSDFKGKYVYIDLWATWCKPCIEEIPYLKNIEKKYKDKNISFLSISLDDPKHEERWRKMIDNKDLSGIQLLADQASKSQFVQEYYIMGIPHFLLLDPKGNIVSKDAPKPSDPELIKTLDTLDI